MKERVQLLQELSNNSWPAKNVFLLSGWLIRVSEGVTNRANSVLPIRYTGSNIAEDIQEVERLYNTHNLPIIFQIADYCEPTNLHEILESRNYINRDETIVMELSIEDLMVSDKNIEYLYSVEYGLDDNWFESLRNINSMTDSRFEGYKKIVDRIILQKLKCSAMKRGEMYGTMLGVIERKHLVIYSMVTHPDYRRKGIARSILTELGIWVKQNEISKIYLQVETENTAARKLYENTGFQEVYRYRYLEKKEQS